MSGSADTELEGERLARNYDAIQILGTMVVAALLSLLAAALSLQIWRADLRVPLVDAEGDALGVLALNKGIIDTGWSFSNPLLGSPSGTAFYDISISFSESLHTVLISLMGRMSDDPALVSNLLFLLGFPLAAAIMAYVAMRLGSYRQPAVVVAVLFSIMPFHYLRGMAHLALSLYYAVPLSVLLIVGSAGGIDLFKQSKQTNKPRWMSSTNAVTISSCLIVATSTSYYTVFTVLLLVGIGALSYLANRKVKQLLSAAAVVGIVCGVFMVQQAPAIFHSLNNGGNVEASDRAPQESEIYGLKLADAILPRPGHRVEALSRLRAEYSQTTPLSNENVSSSIGLVLSLTLVLGFAWLAVSILRRRGSAWSPLGYRVRIAALSTALAISLATVGGGAVFIAYLLTPQLRGWNRISVFIGAFSAVILALALTSFVRRWSPQTTYGRVLLSTGFAALIVIGALDQTSSMDVPRYEQNLSKWRNDSRFVAAVEKLSLPERTPVLQMPYVPFPEHPPVVNMSDYQLFRPYVHTRGKQFEWTYGETKGRAADWLASAQYLPEADLLAGASAVGFGGLYLDRNGFADEGRGIVKTVKSLDRATKPVSSSDGQLLFFPLMSIVRQSPGQSNTKQVATLRRDLLNAPTIAAGTGMTAITRVPGDINGWSASGAKRSTMLVTNRAASVRTIILSGRVEAVPAAERTTLEIAFPGGRRTKILGPRGRRLLISLALPGRSSAEVKFIVKSRACQVHAQSGATAHCLNFTHLSASTAALRGLSRMVRERNQNRSHGRRHY